MPILNLYVTDETMQRLDHASRRLDRGIPDIAEAAVEEAALDWWKKNGPSKANQPPER